ncbi:MAG: hypothetical protein JNK49_06425, partial [Planctomycetes bacterium]|nr:hypothetical protein [Planctomycetota bacterium]
MLRPRSSRRLAYAAAGLVAAVLGTAGLVQVQAERSWRAVTVLRQDVTQRVAARPHHHLPLWGETRPGSAFAAYDEAMRQARRLEQEHGKALVAMRKQNDAQLASDPIATAVRAAARPLLAALQDGAHAAELAPPHPDL